MTRPTDARRLTRFTAVFLIIYAPIETWFSAPALWNPFYLVDFIGMVLLAWGTARCWHAPSPAGLALLVAGYAWEGANFWRALFARMAAVEAGGTLRLGSPELAFVAFGTAAALGALAWSLRLAMTHETPE